MHGYNLRNFFTGELTPNGKRKLSLKNLPTNSLAVTTYETLRDYQFSFAEISWSCIVADEAQKIKNPDAGITKALKAMKCDFAICLSGTPVENSWLDLWSIMDFVQPAHLDALEVFKKKYLARLTEENIQQLGEELKKNLEPLFLRRMKEDFLSGLPAKEIFLCPQEMPLYQSKIYCAVLEKYRRGCCRSIDGGQYGAFDSMQAHRKSRRLNRQQRHSRNLRGGRILRRKISTKVSTCGRHQCQEFYERRD